LLEVNWNGLRIAIPVRAPAVHHNDDSSNLDVNLVGKSAKEHTEGVIDTIIEKTVLPESPLTIYGLVS
jgi:hypothetical protein